MKNKDYIGEINKGYFENRFEKSKIKIKSEEAIFPKNALVEISNACNHACIFCYNPLMQRKLSYLDIETFNNFILNSVSQGLEEVGLYSTGDPMMVKNLDEFIFNAKKNGIKRVYITTNGALADEKKIIKCLDAGLDSIKFSINAGSKEMYKLIHGFDDFDKVKKNLDIIYQLKKFKYKKLQLLCSFIWTDKTFDQMNKFKKDFGKYFEDIFFNPALNQGGRVIKRSNFLTKKNKQKVTPKFVPHKMEFKPCEMLWNRIHLTAEGYLTACCVDYENDLVYEKFDKNKNILDQFNSAKIKNLRKQHLSQKLLGTVCYDCIYSKKTNYKRLSVVNYKKNLKNKNKVNNLENRLAHFEN